MTIFCNLHGLPTLSFIHTFIQFNLHSFTIYTLPSIMFKTQLFPTLLYLSIVVDNFVYILYYYYFMLILCFCFSTCTSGADGSTSGANASRGVPTSSRSYHRRSPSITYYRNRLVYNFVYPLQINTFSTIHLEKKAFISCAFCVV